jgi:ketosteroid isomerase-like protein
MTVSLALAGMLAGFAALQAASPSAAPSPPPPSAPLPSVTLPAPLARVLTDYEQAWARKDAAGLAALFAEDGFVLSSGTPPVRGRAAIERHYTGQGGALALRALAFSTHGSIGFIIGGFARAKGEPDIGKFTLTLVKGAGGRWLIQSDMDNGNVRSR